MGYRPFKNVLLRRNTRDPTLGMSSIHNRCLGMSNVNETVAVRRLLTRG
jgi:hypothetical protein